MKIGCTISLVLTVIAVIAFCFKFYFVFGEGVKAGELNQVVNKGYVFKTYEGKMIQAGFKTGAASASTRTAQQTQGGLQSNEFFFSVENKRVADSLMRCSGMHVELHYREYLGTLPWRGMQVYVVDSIVSVRPSTGVY